MRIRLRLILWITGFLSTAAGIVQAQQPRLAIADSSFHHFTPFNSPLPNENVTKIALSPSGKSVWIATWGGGVTRYYKSRWQTYNKQNSSLPDNDINDMEVAADNTVWLATNLKGVVGFNGKNWQFYDIGKTNTILSLQLDKDQNLWVGTYDEGLFRINTQTQRVEKIWGGSDAIRFAVHAICFDQSNRIWISTNKGIYRSTAPANQTPLKFELLKTDEKAAKQEVQYGLAVDSKGMIWCAGFPNGELLKYDGTNWISYEESAADALAIKSPKASVDPVKQYFKHAFYIDNKDNIYLGTQNHGAIARFDGTTWNWVLQPNAAENKFNYASICSDTSGTFYAGAWSKGLISFKPSELSTNKDSNLLAITNLNGRTVVDQFTFAAPALNGTLQIWDQGLVDGDSITLYVNDKAVLSNYRLTAQKKEITIELQAHSTNKIIVFAHNLGTTPPNTSQIQLSVGKLKQRFTLNSDLKKCGAALVRVQ